MKLSDVLPHDSLQLRCPCGELMINSSFEMNYKCPCGFALSQLDVHMNPVNNFLWILQTKYDQFIQQKHDPMNALPSHYK